MSSLPTIIQEPDFDRLNQERFELILASSAPELWRVYQYLRETNVNPAILPKVIRGIANIASSPSHVGRVIIFVEGSTMSVQIRESDLEREEIFNP